MDAKPQRPARSLRVRIDENAASNNARKKTLHQRYKSTGNLPTENMVNVAGLRAAAKRTAFGDVSNTTRSAPLSKDDSVLTGQNMLQITGKVSFTSLDKKPIALLRPAQRPLSVSGLKGVVNNKENVDPVSVPLPMTTKIADASLAKPLSSVSSTVVPQIVSRKNTVKRSTTIFRDVEREQSGACPRKDSINHAPTPPFHQSSAPIPPVHQSLAPRHHKSQPYLRAEQPVLRKTKSKFFPSTQQRDKENAFAELSLLSNDVGVRLVEHEAVAAPSEASLALVDLESILDKVHTNNDLISGAASQQQEGQHLQSSAEEQERLAEEELRANADAANELLAAAELTESEEYWDDEFDDEIYEDDGYTTARSGFSRGENTTGGATTVLMPRMTNKVRKEIAAAKEIVESSRTLEDVLDESLDSTMVTEYGVEIFQYMRELEIKMLPDAHYMDNQGEIQWSMRSVLMEWIMQVHHRFNLLPETLFLCANYIDRFLSCKIVSLGKLQLVGATAIFIAAKYEEINCPSVSEIAYMVDGGYTVDEILKAERFMLSMLQFELGWPGPMSFLRRVSKADDYDVEIRTLAKYFLEVAIMDERFVASPPSFMAAATDCLARMMLRKGDWTPAHVYYSNYTYAQLRQPMAMLLECCDSPQDHHSVVYEKYADRRYQRAALFAEAQIAKGFGIPEHGSSGGLARISLNAIAARGEAYLYQQQQQVQAYAYRHHG